MLTETGRLVLSYADEIFSLGGELQEMVRNLPSERQLTFKVGVVDVIPKSIAYRLLAPAFELPEPIRIICQEGDANSLLAELAVHKLDLIISDEPIAPSINVRGYSHALGECGISFLAAFDLADKLSDDFPECLNGAPLLLPGETNAVRNHLIQWLDESHIYPRVVGEFDDSALMKAFGQGGTGIFITPTAIANEVAKQFGVTIVGKTDKVKERFFAISVERKVSHPAIVSINDSAREWLE